jgi:hypothetical protein
MGAASALVIATPMASADAATAHHVLTIRKAGGPAVKMGATLKAGLKRGSAAVFSVGSMTLTCKSLRFTTKVTRNPVAPGTARESLTAQKVGKCTVNVGGVTVTSVRAINLPYNVRVSDARGLHVRVSERSTTKPIRFTATVMFGSTPITCSYRARSIAGTASNTGNVIVISMQKFTRAPGSSSLCSPSASFSATFGPVRDFSVTGHPAVFVN